MNEDISRAAPRTPLDTPVGDRSADSSVNLTSTDLQRNAVGLPGVLMQGISHISPAFAIATSFQFVVALAGVTTPVVFAIAFAIVFMLALSVSQAAKAFTSAGGFYTYISRTVDPRAGFLCGWAFSIWFPPTCALVMAYAAKIIQDELKAQYHFTLPWVIPTLVVAIGVYLLVRRGIKISTNVVVILGSLEILVMLVLALAGLASPGRGGITLAPFNPVRSASLQGLYLGVVFSILTFSGWEATTPLAEESKDPRRNVPRGLLGAVIILGVYFVITSYGYTIGLGTANVHQVAVAGRNPIFSLAESRWGSGWLLVLFALLNSGIAVSIASFNAATRTWYAMGRSGTMPAAFAKVHPQYRTPVNAINLQFAVTLLCVLIAVWLGPANAFFLWGLTITLALIYAYICVNIGVFRHYWGVARHQFNPFLHVIFPLVSSLAVLWVGYKSVVPLPAPPVKWAPVVIAVWLAAGIVVMVVLTMRGHRDWLHKAGAALAESGDEESAALPGASVPPGSPA